MIIGVIASFVVAVGLSALAGTPYIFAQRKQQRAARHRESNVNEHAYMR